MHCHYSLVDRHQRLKHVAIAIANDNRNDNLDG